MRALVQRVREAGVSSSGQTVASIGRGLLVFLGVARGDAEEDADYLARKVAGLRVFEDAEGKMNLSLRDVGGEALVVSQFTLHADTRRGNRPSFAEAEEPGRAESLYLDFAGRLRGQGVPVATGRFAASMEVSLVNDGPVTIMVDSRR
ncbi:MAG: D-aminoacyl-tRNA deacylase [Thermodesulfovibrionales bacterium]